MNPLIHKARALRLQSQSHAAEADYRHARGDFVSVVFHQSMAASYADMADATEAEATEEAA